MSNLPILEQWQNLVKITQFMWKHGDIPRYLGWIILVLIPKGNTDTRGIGLLESMWKLVESIIETLLRESVRLHDVLHSFCSGRGTGTSILEPKLAQELTRVDQDPLFLVLLDPKKACNIVVL